MGPTFAAHEALIWAPHVIAGWAVCINLTYLKKNHLIAEFVVKTTLPMILCQKVHQSKSRSMQNVPKEISSSAYSHEALQMT